MNNDSFKSRTFYINKNYIELRIANTVPIMISQPDRLKREHVIREVDGVTNDVPLTDPDMPDRFIPIGGSRSALTESIVLFYYDKKYKDIIITPDFKYLTLPEVKQVFQLAAYRLGSNTPLRDGDITTMLGLDETTRFELPETKTGLKFKSSLLSLTGTGTNNNAASDRFEELIGNIWNINHFARRPSVLIELGTPANLFNNPSPLHLYLLGQLSVIDFSVYYAGYIETNLPLYLHFKF